MIHTIPVALDVTKGTIVPNKWKSDHFKLGCSYAEIKLLKREKFPSIQNKSLYNRFIIPIASESLLNLVVISFKGFFFADPTLLSLYAFIKTCFSTDKIPCWPNTPLYSWVHCSNKKTHLVYFKDVSVILAETTIKLVNQDEDRNPEYEI